MDFDLSSDQKMLADTVASFVKKQSPVDRFRKLREDNAGWQPEVWAHMGELGWLSIPFPEELGGFGASFVEVYLLLEKFGTTLVPEPFIPSVVLAGMALLRAGNSAQQESLLAPMIEGKTSLAFAHAERGNRHDADPIATTATKSGQGWALTGEKVFVLNGHRADHIVVSAQTPDGAALFVVDGNGPGVTRQTVRTIDEQGAATLRLDGAIVDDARRLGEPGEATVAVIEHVLDYGAAAAVAEGLGVCQAMLDMTRDHLKMREQFGRPIGSFQALQHRAVDMFVELELLRSMAMLAAMRVDDPDPTERRRAISAAKVKLTTGGRAVAQQAIQLHGGIGITDEHDIGLYFKRMQVLGALFGDAEHHVQRFSALPDFPERS
jgi:alkylation response protein AidB-like acyl-CoA dehydrogenase